MLVKPGMSSMESLELVLRLNELTYKGELEWRSILFELMKAAGEPNLLLLSNIYCETYLNEKEKERLNTTIKKAVSILEYGEKVQIMELLAIGILQKSKQPGFGYDCNYEGSRFAINQGEVGKQGRRVRMETGDFDFPQSAALENLYDTIEHMEAKKSRRSMEDLAETTDLTIEEEVSEDD